MVFKRRKAYARGKLIRPQGRRTSKRYQDTALWAWLKVFFTPLQPICGPIVFIQKLSIFSFSVGFSENQRHLELVWDPGDKIMSSIYLKMGEKAVISEECVARSLCY